MEPEGSLPHSQEPATCLYPEPARSSPYPTSHFLKIHLNIILPTTSVSPKWSITLRFPHQNLAYASLLPHTRYMPRPSHSVCIIIIIIFIIIIITPWCRVLLEKLTDLQLVKKFPAFHGTRRFITALTSVRHLSLSWVSPIQFIYPHPTSWRSILIQ